MFVRQTAPPPPKKKVIVHIGKNFQRQNYFAVIFLFYNITFLLFCWRGRGTLSQTDFAKKAQNIAHNTFLKHSWMQGRT
jgi:hypothetical protein